MIDLFASDYAADYPEPEAIVAASEWLSIKGSSRGHEGKEVRAKVL